MDWLNRHTDEQVDFFGVRLETIRIDDSKPAVQFRLMAFPNKWGKAQTGRVAKIISASAGNSIPQLRSHRTRWKNRLKTANEDEKAEILNMIAEYDRRITEAEEEIRAAAAPRWPAALASVPV